MTISSTDDPRAGPYNGNGSQTAFPFEFKIFAAADLLVVTADDEGAETTLVLDSDYSVAMNADQDADPGGTVTYPISGTALPTGSTLTIASDLEFTQTTDITNGSGFYPRVIENALDRVTMLIKQTNSKVLRALQLAVSSPEGVDVTLPAPVANQVIGWDADGISLANYAADTSISTAVLENRLASTASASDGAGMVGEDPSLNYAAGTVGWWDKHAGVSLLRFMPISTLAGIVAGTNTTDLSTYLQTALDAALSGGFELNGHGYGYKCDSALTWQRSSAGHTKRMVFHSAELDFSDLGIDATALTVGATSSTYFLEDGGIVLRDLTLLGPENTALDPRTDAPGGSSIGLYLQFAGGVTMENVRAFYFFKNCKTQFVFPLKATNCNFRRAWVGVHLDEASNDQVWDMTTLTNCRYPILIKADSTALDSGKINNVTFNNPWMEGSRCGVVIDSGTGGAGAERFRSLSFNNSYCALITNDHFRIGTAWTLATPDTRGANCSEFISDVRIKGGLFNPTGGLYSATQALVAMDSATRVRDLYIDTPTLDDDADGDVIVGAPGGGMYISRGFPGISNAKIRITLWDSTGAMVRRMVEDGSILIGSAKTAAATVSTVGHELSVTGVQYQTADGAATRHSNRLTSDGSLEIFYRSSVAVGSISVTTTATAYNTSSDRSLKTNFRPLDFNAAHVLKMTKPGSYDWIATGAAGHGYIAQQLYRHFPHAVTRGAGRGKKRIPWQVDNSKLVPVLHVALVDVMQEVHELRKEVDALRKKASKWSA